MSSPQPMAASLMGPPRHTHGPETPARDPYQRPENQQSSPPSARGVTAELQPADQTAVDQPEPASEDAKDSSRLSDEYKQQTDREKQTAASALLAQLLGGQTPAAQKQQQQDGEEGSQTQSQNETSSQANGNDIKHVTMAQDHSEQALQPPPSSPPEVNAIASQHHHLDDDPEATNRVLQAAWDMSEPHQPSSTTGQNYLSEGLHGDNEIDQNNNSTPLPKNNGLPLDAIYNQPNMNSDTNHVYSDMPPLTTPKTAKEALAQHELLTSTYLPSGAQNSGPTPRMVGYPELPTPSEGVPPPSRRGSESAPSSEPRIQAYAKLEFDDGHFYVNTYSFILGRDVRAARAAFQRDLQTKQVKAQVSSGGSVAATPNRSKNDGNAIVGSVVSDRGGIMGFDPDVPQNVPPQVSWKSSNNSSSGDQNSHPMLHMAQAAEGEPQVTNQAVPIEKNKDYNALAMESLQRKNEPKRVDTLTLLPSAEACPTIPVHPPTLDDGTISSHRSISRKHVRISYNFTRNLFEMEVMGRNGAFKGADWLAPGQVRPLHSGDFIQIGGVRVRFLLPDVPIGETGAEREESPIPDEEDEEIGAEIGEEEQESESGIDVDETGDGGSLEPMTAEEKAAQIKKEIAAGGPTGRGAGTSTEATPNASQAPAKRRGPGRPPKDGIMSKRERAEIAREQKLAAKREANGGVTPPPSNRQKAGKTPKEGPPEDTVKVEKRKYTKRKKSDSGPVDTVLPSIEANEGSAEPAGDISPKIPSAKKRKPSKSPSPDYPPESYYSAKELAKPPYNYAVLIYDALSESEHPMTLKQIYRALKLKYPYFRFKCETEGWTSSVRHNLNGNTHLFMHAERDGKGWSWKIIPGASVDKEKKRRPSPPPMSDPANLSHNQQQYRPPSNPQPYTAPQGALGQPGGQHYSPYPPPPPMGHNPFPMPPPPQQQQQQPPQNTPYPPPAPATTAQPSLPSSLRDTFPPAFAPPTTTSYRSPYSSTPPYPPQPRPAPPPQQQQQQPPHHYQPQGQRQYPPPPPHQQQQQQPPHPQPPAQAQSSQSQLPSTFTFQARPQPVPGNHNPPTNAHSGNQGQPQPPPPPPHPGPSPSTASEPQPTTSMPQQPSNPPHSASPQKEQQSSTPEPSFMVRANRAIDNFEAVLMEDYEDKEYIQKVLRSARDRVLNGTKESSFPGGEAKDEAVIMDALSGIIGQLNQEDS